MAGRQRRRRPPDRPRRTQRRIPAGRATWLLQTRVLANPADQPATVPPGTTDKTATDFADLITRQVRSPAGYRLLPQGTPTNNSGDLPAGAPDGPAAATATTDWLNKTDGQWLTELVGVDPATPR